MNPFSFFHMQVFVTCSLSSYLWLKCLFLESYTGSATAPLSNNSGSWLSPDQTTGAQVSPLSLPPWTTGNLKKRDFCKLYFILWHINMRSLSIQSSYGDSAYRLNNTEYSAHQNKSKLMMWCRGYNWRKGTLLTILLGCTLSRQL